MSVIIIIGFGIEGGWGSFIVIFDGFGVVISVVITIDASSCFVGGNETTFDVEGIITTTSFKSFVFGDLVFISCFG